MSNWENDLAGFSALILQFDIGILVEKESKLKQAGTSHVGTVLKFKYWAEKKQDTNEESRVAFVARWSCEEAIITNCSY